MVITRRKSLMCMVPTTTVTRMKCYTSSDCPFATLTRIGSFNGTGLIPACFTTSALMNESDAPESSSAKWVVHFRIKGRKSNGIGGGGSGPSSIISEAVSQDSAEIWHTAVNEHAVWASVGTANNSKCTFQSNRATAIVALTGLLLDTSTACLGKAGFR